MIQAGMKVYFEIPMREKNTCPCPLEGSSTVRKVIMHMHMHVHCIVHCLSLWLVEL